MAHPFQHYMLGLFAVANNFPALGMFLAICQGRSPAEQRRLAKVATITAFVTMLTALISGQLLLEFFGIGVQAFRIAGGILLCVSGMNMLNSPPARADSSRADPADLSNVIPEAIVPIGIPLTTGAGTISTVILYSTKLTDWGVTGRLFVAIGIMAVLIYWIFRYSTVLLRALGKTGMSVLIKILGLITLAIGIQFLVTGIGAEFPAWVR